MASAIDSKTKRDRLAPRREPYWTQLREGRHLGYRKPGEGEGAWIAKYRDAVTGKRVIRSLGAILEESSIKAFEKARRAAEAWFDELDKGVRADAPRTVREACTAYAESFPAEKAARTLADFRRTVFSDPIADVPLERLRPDVLEAWRKRMESLPVRVGKGSRLRDRTRSPASVNRELVPVRAALNRAFKRGEVASDRAWRLALTPIRNADRSRGVYLDREQRRQLLEHASAESKPFLQALCLLPLRPGALAALTVAAFDARTATLRVAADKAGAYRSIGLPAGTVEILKAQAKDKLPAAPLFAMADGRAWSRDQWKKHVRAAVTAAGLADEVTAYALRHSVITDLVTSGLDILTVAQISGTSVAMVEKHYGHLQREHAAQALAGLAL